MKDFILLLFVIFVSTGTSMAGTSLAIENDSVTKSIEIINKNANYLNDLKTFYKENHLNYHPKISLLNFEENKFNSYRTYTKKYRNPNFLYTLMPIYQSNGTIGFEIGELNLRGIGWFASLKANLGVTDASSPDQEIDRESIDKDAFDLGAASLSGGITKSLFYPLYLYVGGGVAYHKYYTEDEGDVTAVNLDSSSGYYVFPEAALGIQFGSMAIKGGAAYIDEDFYFNVGIGFGG